MRYLIIPFFGFVKTALTDVGTVFASFDTMNLKIKYTAFISWTSCSSSSCLWISSWISSTRIDSMYVSLTNC